MNQSAALLELLDAFDLEAEACFQHIKPMLPPDTANEIQKWIAALEFEPAGAALRTIREQFSAAPGEETHG